MYLGQAIVPLRARSFRMTPVEDIGLHWTTTWKTDSLLFATPAKTLRFTQRAGNRGSRGCSWLYRRLRGASKTQVTGPTIGHNLPITVGLTIEENQIFGALLTT